MNTCPQEGIVHMYFTAPRHPPPVWSAGHGDGIAIVPPPQLCLGSEEIASFLLSIDLFQESFSGKSQASQQLSLPGNKAANTAQGLLRKDTLCCS